MTTEEEQQGGIVVCMKWVATRPEVDPLTGDVSADARFSGISPADRAALEWSLRVGDKEGLPVTAVTVGPAAAEAGLREALAAGVSKAVHVLAEDLELSSQTVADVLATVSRSADLVFCGDHSLDRGSGSVPAFLASRLSTDQALGCVGLELTTEHIVAERRLDQGRRERLQLTGPTVVSFEGGLELRRAGLAATLDASDGDVDVRHLGDVSSSNDANLGRPHTITASGPYRPRPRVLPAPQGSTIERVQQLTGAGEEQPAAQQVELPPAEAAQAVIDQLQAWGYVTDDVTDGDATDQSS